jgi:glucose 1-dehydrogenase
MGKAITMKLAGAGARVIASDINYPDDASRSEFDEAGVTFRAADVSDAAAVEDLVSFAVAHRDRLDCAVNAAAIEFETRPLADCPVEDFDRMIAVNLRSVFLCCKFEIAAMRTNGGSIVNIASTNSFKPQAHQPAYTASKHGVLGLTRSAAIDHARDRVRVNCIAPGAIDTPMLRTATERWGSTPEDMARKLSAFRRFGQPDEIAEAALWLCSDASSFVTGHALTVDGGLLLM